MIPKLLVFLAVLLFLQAGNVNANNNKSNITGIYSSLCFNKESGDLNGVEVYIVFSTYGVVGGDYYAVVQVTEGAVFPPEVSVIKKTQNKGYVMKLEKSPYAGEYTLQFTSGGLLMTINDQNKKISLHLPKTKSYWETTPTRNCQ